MEKDIVPGLLEEIQKEFHKNFNKSKKIKALEAKVRDGTATYIEAQRYAEETGKILAQVLKKHITEEALPDGRMYYNIAQRILRPTLGENHKLITNITTEVQNTLNKKAGLGLKSIVPEFNQERIDGLVNHLDHAETFEEISRTLDEPIKQHAMSVVSDAIEANAKFQYDAGLQPKIVREAEYKCCEWCDRLKGAFRYPDEVPTDVYRRHDRCRCTVDYVIDKKRKNIHHGNSGRKRRYIKDEYGNYSKQQNYIPVEGKKKTIIFDAKMGNLQITQIDGYSDVYVHDGVKIKPKALHSINQNVSSAIKDYGGDTKRKPKVVIVELEKLGALGKYDCVKNVIYVAPEVGDKISLSKFTVQDSNIKFGSTEYHEMWHWMQAQNYGNVITEETRVAEYMPWLNEKCRKSIENLGVTEYNVDEISDYAKEMFRRNRYDEVEAEYYTKQSLKRR